jgi:long-subunit fatty acid transport protein
MVDDDTRFSLRRENRRRCLRVGLALVLLGVLITPLQVHGQAKVGTTGAQFLELGVSSRAMAMAEAYTAVVDDISAVYYNPAALTQLYGREAAFTYIDMPADIGFGWVAYGMPLESIGGVLGLSMSALSSGEMVEYLATSGPGGSGRTFYWNDFSFSASYGRYLTDRFSLGFTVRYIGQFVHDYSASGWSADVGTSYDTGHRGFKIAMVITNFGPDLTMISNAYPLPINFKFGGAINLIEGDEHLLTLSAEGTHPSDNLEKYNAGLEYVFQDKFILRAGRRFNYDEDGFTAGGGLILPYGDEQEVRVDYAFQDFGVLTQVHRFSMTWAF